MMRRLLVALFCFAVMFMTACEDKDSVSYLSKQEVYFFYQTTCPHCHTAADYIKEKHANLKVKGFDIKMPGNMRLFQKAVKEYKIAPDTAGTPLIAMGNKYVMGWGEDKQKIFEDYVTRYEE